MNDAKEFVSLEVAIGMLHERENNEGYVHTFRGDGLFIVGADWDRAELIEAMRHAPNIEVTGENAHKMGHGLAIQDAHGYLFIETHDPLDEDRTGAANEDHA